MALAACSSSDSSPKGTPPTQVEQPSVATLVPTTVAVPTGPTPWSQAVESFDPEGTPDVTAALTMFTMALGPIDGFPAPPADSGAFGDVSIAFRAVAGVWDQLTPEQRNSVMAAATGIDANSTATELGFRSAPAAKPDQALVDAVNSAAIGLRSKIAARIGDFTGKLTVIVSERDDAARDLGMATPTINGDGSFSGGCTLRNFPTAFSTTAERLVNTIAHEVFHCFQFAALGSLARFARAPSWVIEGGAEWAAAMITSPDDTTPGRWTLYFATPKVPLYLRKYDAIAVWSHLAESGTDPWSVFRAVWATDGTPAAFLAAGANTPAFLDAWASGATRVPARGAGWDTTGPGITPIQSIGTWRKSPPLPG